MTHCRFHMEPCSSSPMSIHSAYVLVDRLHLREIWLILSEALSRFSAARKAASA
jgi:hypothetical protein